MLLGKVVGTLVATRKETTLEGLKFLVLKQVDVDGSVTLDVLSNDSDPEGDEFSITGVQAITNQGACFARSSLGDT